MVAPVQDKELKELIDAVKAGEARRDQAIQEAIAQIADGKNVEEIKAAVKQIEAEHKQVMTDVRQQMALIRKVAWDERGNYRGIFGSEEDARGFGLQVLAACTNNAKAMEIIKSDYNDLHQRAQATNPDSSGGSLVDPGYSDRVIRLVEEYGVFRRNAMPMPMTSNTLSYKKQTGEPTMYLVGEGVAPSESTLTFANVNLTARKWGTLIYFPEELAEDTAGLIGEMVARSIAWASAYWEDKVGFTGDGSLTNLRVTGVAEKLKGLSATIANIAGLHVGAGNAYSELTLDDHIAVIAKCPGYAIGMAKWYTSLPYFFNVMVKLMMAVGGVTAAEVQGRRQLMFLGFPNEIAQAQPTLEGNSQVCALFGDLRQAVDFGTRRSLQIKRSEHYKFAEGQVTVLGTQRQDIQVHSVGNADATAADRVAGPIVGLITAAA